jgi:hypothetical protein
MRSPRCASGVSEGGLRLRKSMQAVLGVLRLLLLVDLTWPKRTKRQSRWSFEFGGRVPRGSGVTPQPRKEAQTIAEQAATSSFVWLPDSGEGSQPRWPAASDASACRRWSTPEPARGARLRLRCPKFR